MGPFLTSILAIATEQEAATPGIFDINTGLSFWTLVIFLILLGVLYKFAYPSIIGAVEERERHIQEVLDAAARDRQHASTLLEEQQAKLDQARLEAQQIIQEGKQAAERIRQEMVAEARQQQEDLLERARREIAVEREAALSAVRREAVELSVQAASALIGRKLDSAVDRQIVTEYLTGISAGNGGRSA